MRIVGFLQIYIPAVIAFYAVLLPQRSNISLKLKLVMFGFALLGATSIVTFFLTWLPTPNYNLLNFSAMLLVALSMVLQVRYEGRHFKLAAWILGAGGTLSFLAKPSTAIFVALIALTFILLYRRTYDTRNRSKRFLLLSIAVSLVSLLVAALVLDGSLLVFVQSLFDGLDASRITIGKGWGSVSQTFWHGKLQSDFRAAYLAIPLAVVLLAYIVREQQISLDASGLWLGLIFSLLGILYLASILSGLVANPIQNVSRSDLFLIIWGGLFCLCLFFTVYGRPSFLIWLTATLMFALAYASVVGTTNNYFNVLPMYSALGVLALLLILRATVRTDHAFIACCAWLLMLSFMVSVLSIDKGLSNPYRQAAWAGSESTSLVERGSLTGITIDTLAAKYHNDLNSLALDHRFALGTPVIDLSGRSPGSVFSIGGSPAGAYWLIGGYIGSAENAMIRIAEHQDKIDISHAWVITEHSLNSNLHDSDEHKSSIPYEILNILGKQLSENYMIAGEVIVPAGYGGRPKATRQRLHKPKY